MGQKYVTMEVLLIIDVKNDRKSYRRRSVLSGKKKNDDVGRCFSFFFLLFKREEEKQGVDRLFMFSVCHCLVFSR